MSKEVAKNPENTAVAIIDPIFENFDSVPFEEASVEFLDFKDLEGVELQMFMEQKIEMEIKGETKDFVKLFLNTTSGKKMYYGGQKKLLQTFERYDMGRGVMAKVTFKGKIKLDGGKTLNDFVIFARPA